MRTTGNNMNRITPISNRMARRTSAAVGVAFVLAASLAGCGDVDAKKQGSPSTGTVNPAPNSGTSTAAQLTTNGSAAVSPVAFTRDEGSKLLDDHLSPPQYVPIEPPPAAVAPAQRPLPKVERVNFEQLWQPPAAPAVRLVLPREKQLTERRLPLRELPPLASSLAPLPPAPALEAGPLLLAASRDADDAFELPASAPTPESPFAGDPATVPARAAANPVISSGRVGPAPFSVVVIPSPQEHDLPHLPTVEAPPAETSVYPLSAGRLMPGPVMVVAISAK